MAIHIAGESAEMKVITLNRLSAKLKGKYLKTRTTHSQDR